MNKKKHQPERSEVRSGDEHPHSSTNPVPTTEGHPAAVRGTSATPGEAGSRGTEGGQGAGLTERLDGFDENEEGIEGRLGGQTADFDEDMVGGTEMDEFDEHGTPRRGDLDW
jgi:hypothetical protein